ncbi:unnamed protein product, partial [Owenia fusiformis]
MGIFATLLDTILNNFTTSLVFLVVFLLIWQYMKPSPWHLPEHPTPWPLLGNMSVFEIGQVGDDTMFDLYQKFKTPIMYRKFMVLHAAVLHTYELVKEVYSDDRFVDRAPTPLDEFVFKGIVDVSGPRWREQRRFALSTLRDFGLGKNKIERKIQEEIASGLCGELDSKDGKAFDPSNLIAIAISNMICSLVFGHRFEYKDEQFQGMVRRQNENNVHSVWVFIGAILPLTSWLPGDLFHKKRLLSNIEELKANIFVPEFQRHMEEFDSENINDFMDAFIREMKLREGSEYKDHWFTEEQLMWNIEDLFAAGTDTTTLSMKWLFLRMLHHPDVQQRVKKDIHNVIGKERIPSMKDKLDLPYIEAVLLETQRMHIIVPFSIGRSCLNDKPIEVKGYIFPPKTAFLSCNHSIHFNADHFEDPNTFNPDRFIGPDGKFQKDDHVLTFSVGKRACLGESLAKQELFLFFTALLQRYRLEVPPGEPLPSMERVPGLTVGPKPFKMCFIRDNV